MAAPPYPGQGSRLPGDCAYKGDWVVEGAVFICRLPQSMADVPFVGLDSESGTADGFNADILASQLEVTTDHLFALNRRKLLKVEWRTVPTEPGADITVEYTIQTPDSGVSLDLCRARIKGRA